MTENSQYSEEQKEATVKFSIGHGKNLLSAPKSLGYPVDRWIKSTPLGKNAFPIVLRKPQPLTFVYGTAQQKTQSTKVCTILLEEPIPW